MKNFFLNLILILIVCIPTSMYIVKHQQKNLDDTIEKWVYDNPDYIISSVQKMQEKSHQERIKQTIVDGKKEYGKMIYDTKYLPFIGDKNATESKTIIGFLDYSCIYCKITKDYAEQIIEKMPDLKFIFMPVTSIGGERSKTISKYAIAIFMYNNDKFTDAHEKLFSIGKEEDYDKQENHSLKIEIERMLESLDVNVEEFNEFLAKNQTEIEKQINNNNNASFAMGIAGTPAFLYGENEIIMGALPIDEVIKKLEAYINK